MTITSQQIDKRLIRPRLHLTLLAKSIISCYSSTVEILCHVLDLLVLLQISSAI